MPYRTSRVIVFAVRLLLPMLALSWLTGAAPLVVDGFAASATHTYYDIEVRFNPDGKNIHVLGGMNIPPPRPKPLRIALSRSFPAPILRIVDPGFPLKSSYALTHNPALPLAQAWQTATATAWDVRIPPTLRDDETLSLAFEYDGGSTLGRVFAIAPNESYADGSTDPWYPQLRATEKDGDVPNVVATVQYTYPVGRKLVSSGKAYLSGGQMVTTGNGPATAQNTQYSEVRIYRVQRPQPISFALGTFQSVASPAAPAFELNYITKRPDIERRRDWVRSVVDRYVTWYGPYPHEAWRLVEVLVFAWGNDADDLVPYSTQLIDDWNDANFAHELSHPYWGGDYLANEGMATFAALETFEAEKGAAAAERFRRTGAPGYFENASGLGYLRIAAAGFDSPLGVPAGTNGPEQNIDFGKGMLVLDMLARAVGRDKFHAFLRSYWAEQRAQEFTTFSWPGFFTALSKETGKDWQFFYDQWFARGGAPEWTFTWHNENRVVVGEVVQAGQPFRFDLPLEGRDQDGHLYTTVIRVAGPRSTVRWTLPAVMRDVKDDPHYTVLHWTPEYRTLANALAPFTRWNYRRYDGVDADLAGSLISVPVDDPYGTRFALEYAMARIQISRRNWHEAKRVLNAALAERITRPESVPSAYLALARVEGEPKNVAAQREALQKALATARKYSDESAAARAERQLAQP